MKKKDLLIVIPAYNEEENLGKVLEALAAPEISCHSDVLVINDASVDHTPQIAYDHGARVVTNIINMGYGCGLQIGYKFAVRYGYKYVIQIDGDGQHDVCNITRIYEALSSPPADEAPDIVLGSRYMEGSSAYNPGKLRDIAYRWFRFVIRRMTGINVADPTTGLQGLSRRTLAYYSRYQRFDDRYPDANMLVQMLLLGFRVEQIPAVMHYRNAGKSMHSGLLKPAVYMLRMTLQLLAVWIRIRFLKIDGRLVHSLQTDKNI